MTTKINNSKHKECVLILQNIFEMMTVIIDTGNDKGISALDIIEDCLRVERLEDDSKQVQSITLKEMSNKQEGLLN